MVEKSLAWWLRYGGLSTLSATRKSNLLLWRQFIRHNVWIGRPRNQGTYGCVLTRIDTRRGYNCSAEFDQVFAITQVDIYGRSDHAATKIPDLADYLRLSISQFNGTWNTLDVGSVQINREGHLTEPPTDGSVYWNHRYSLDFEIEFFQTVVNQGA